LVAPAYIITIPIDLAAVENDKNICVNWFIQTIFKNMIKIFVIIHKDMVDMHWLEKLCFRMLDILHKII
jgi:hypothetical protein